VEYKIVNCNGTESLHLIGDVSSDAQFFVATGVLSFLYCIGITVVYIMFDAVYQNNGLLPLAVRLNLLRYKFMINLVKVYVCVYIYIMFCKILLTFSIYRISS
jgi:hypothetical protein